MKIDCVKVGRLRCNCYILECEGQVLVIDPGDEFDKIEKVIGSKKVVGVIITHHHNDHDGAVEEVVNRYRCKVYDRYNLDEEKDVLKIFDGIGKKIGAIKNNEIDYDKVYDRIIRDLKDGYLGNVTFDNVKWGNVILSLIIT